MTDSVQITDGKWALASGKIRVVERGYDRVLAFGDTTWQDYVMMAKLTVTGFDSSLLAYNSPSNGPSIAFLMRWKGHTTNPIPERQPLEGYLPLGGYAALSWPTISTQQWDLMGNDLIIKESKTSPELQFDTTYFFKMQVTTFEGQGGFYRFKFWKASEAEPVAWFLSGQEGLSGPQQGSALIVAHHVSATIDDVVFTPLPYDNVPPSLSNIQSETAGRSAYVTFNTDEPARARIDYGTTAAYGAVAIADSGMHMSHGVPHDRTDRTQRTIIEWSFPTTPPTPRRRSIDIHHAGCSVADHPRDGRVQRDNAACAMDPVNPLGDATIATPDTCGDHRRPLQPSRMRSGQTATAPCIMQAANNTDVQVEVKWNSAITGTTTEYRTQGIVAEQDANNLIRFDFTSTPAGTYMFAASFLNGFSTDAITIRVYRPANGATGTQPLYMRVAREGDVWSQWYSTNGTSWTLATRFFYRLTLAGAGLFAGNAGTAAPSFTSRVDYFRATPRR
jgi:hypothetical protein